MKDPNLRIEKGKKGNKCFKSKNMSGVKAQKKYKVGARKKKKAIFCCCWTTLLLSFPLKPKHVLSPLKARKASSSSTKKRSTTNHYLLS